jgi:hypothetical protein
MKYIAVDVSGFLDRTDHTGDTNDVSFDLEKLFNENWAVFADDLIGNQSAKRAKEKAKQEFRDSYKGK